MLAPQLEDLRHQITDTLLVVMSLTLIPSSIISFLRISDINIIPLFYVASIGLPLLWFVTICRKKISPRIKALLLVSSLCIIPNYCIYQFGLLAGAIPLSILGIFICYIISGAQTSLVLVFANLSLFTIAGFSTDWGRDVTIEADRYSILASSWATNISTLGVVCLSLIGMQSLINSRINKIHKDLRVAEVTLRENNIHLKNNVEARTRDLEKSNAMANQLNIELQKAKEAAERLAVTDELTGLYNRRMLSTLVTKKISSAIRYRTPTAFYIIDVDFFKKFNDRYGHQAGDIALRKVGKIISSAAKRSDDCAIRIGGEEFCLFLYDADLEYVTQVANDLISNIEDQKIPHETSSVSTYLTVSVGVAYISNPTSDYSMDDYYLKADQALYKAKSLGRNQKCLSCI